MKENPIHCEKCNSTNIEAKEQGFDKETAAVGGMLFGGLGMLVAGYKNRNMVIIHCLDCKYQSNHSRAMGIDYKTFKAEFYELYTKAKYQQANAHYSSYAGEPEADSDNVHEVYTRFRREDQRSQLITFSFVIFLILLLVLLFSTYA